MKLRKIPYKPLYTKVKRQKSIKEFILHLYQYYNYRPYSNRGYCVKSYYDKECTHNQFRAGRRSFEDIYCIVKTEYPSLTQRKLHIIFKDLVENYKFNNYYCSTPKNVVWKFYFELNKVELKTTNNYRVKGVYSGNDFIKIWKNL